VVCALPDLRPIRVGENAIREIEALSSTSQGDAIIICIMPCLGGKVVVALPDLHVGAAYGVCTSVQAEISPSHAELGVRTVDNPFLRFSSVAIINLDRRSIRKHRTANIKTLFRIPVWVKSTPVIAGRLGECTIVTERHIVPFVGHACE